MFSPYFSPYLWMTSLEKDQPQQASGDCIRVWFGPSSETFTGIPMKPKSSQFLSAFSAWMVVNLWRILKMGELPMQTTNRGGKNRTIGGESLEQLVSTVQSYIQVSYTTFSQVQTSLLFTSCCIHAPRI